MVKTSRLILNGKGSTFGSNCAGSRRAISLSGVGDTPEGDYVPCVPFVLPYGGILFRGLLSQPRGI